jgi:SH3-like domain-containing protein
METALVKYMSIYRFLKAFSVAMPLVLMGLYFLMHTETVYGSERVGNQTLLSLPRFVSLRTEPANMRRGPGTNFPVVWVYKRKHLPVEVIEEFDEWRQVRDPSGSVGWIHKSILSGRRMGVIQASNVNLFRGSTVSSSILAVLSQGVLVRLQRCPKNTSFCFIKAGSHKGWVLRQEIWGVYNGEHIN